MSRHALRASLDAPELPLEPLGDRPALWSPFGDVWQRFGPPGTATWWCAQPNGADRGLTYAELHHLCNGTVIHIQRPDLPDQAYTTDSIPVVRDAGVTWEVFGG